MLSGPASTILPSEGAEPADVQNSLTVHIGGNGPILQGGLQFQGGSSGSDSLMILDDSAANVVHTVTDATSGTFDIDGVQVSYSGVQAATDSIAGTLTGIPASTFEGTEVVLGSSLGETLSIYQWTVTYDNLLVASSSDPTIRFTPIEDGDYVVQLTVSADGSKVGTVRQVIHVADAALTGSSAATATGGVEGVTVATLGNATFTDANTGAPSTDFTTSIDWGDGNTNDATSGSVSGSGGSYSVSGTHPYAEEGTYHFTITVTDDGSQTAIITASTTVSDPAVVATGGQSISAVEGSASASQVVATFTDPGGAEPVGDYGASINWGDNQTSTGAIAPALAAAAPVSLTGFNEDVVYEAGANPQVSTTFDQGLGDWYQSGAQDASSVVHNNGLSQSFTSNLGTPFAYQSFTGNDTLFLGRGDPNSNNLTFTTPCGATM